MLQSLKSASRECLLRNDSADGMMWDLPGVVVKVKFVAWLMKIVPPLSCRDFPSLPSVWVSCPKLVDMYWSQETQSPGRMLSAVRKPSLKEASGCFGLMGGILFCLVAYWYASYFGGIQLDAPRSIRTMMHSWRCPLACEPFGEWGLDSRLWMRWKSAWPSLQCKSNNSRCWGCKLKLSQFMTLFLASESEVFWI